MASPFSFKNQAPVKQLSDQIGERIYPYMHRPSYTAIVIRTVHGIDFTDWQREIGCLTLKEWQAENPVHTCQTREEAERTYQAHTL